MVNKSFFQKLMQKTTSSKVRSNIVKKAVSGICATAIILTLLFLTGCSNITDSFNDIINLDQNNNQENPYKEYSPILQNVLTDNYYNWLIQEAESDKKNDNYSYRDSNIYHAIPYGFLEDEGFDVEAIKNNNLKCETEVFILDDEPNSLYLTCRVENKASTDYYTHFVLKYQLTEQELKDLKLVYKNIAQGYNSSYQAAFFIQELSEVKNAVKLSEMNITKESEKEAEKHIETDNFKRFDLSQFGNSISVTYVKEKIEDDNITPSSTYLFFGDLTSSTIQSKKLSQLTITCTHSQVTNVDGEQVYTGVVPTLILTIYKTQVEDSLKTATFFNLGSVRLVDMLNDEYFKNAYGINK